MSRTFTLIPLLPSLGQTSKHPEPVIIDRETSYKIQEILNSKLERSKLLYLVKWKGYSAKHNSWEPELNILPYRKRSLDKFHCIHLTAPQRINKFSFDNLKLVYWILTELIDKTLPNKLTLTRSLRLCLENES